LLAPFASKPVSAAGAPADFVSRCEDPKPTSELLAERAKAGCLDSFEQLVDRHGGQVFHFLRQFTGNHHDAEDLTQETFVRAYQSLHRFDCSFSFATWLFTIARRTGANHFRSARSFEELPEEEESVQETPATTLEKKDEQASIWQLVRTLKPKQAQAIWLRYAQGFSIAELARIMGTNQIYIKVLLHRGRANLLKALAARRLGSAEKTSPRLEDNPGQPNRGGRTEPL
jgi:RNA polymerase sigma-70 factor (ECF subfamily)